MGNTCSGGFPKQWKKSKKKKVSPTAFEHQLVRYEEWELGNTETGIKLNADIWSKVFQYFKYNTKELLACRVVCRDFKAIADDLLSRQRNWTPLFPYVSALPLIFIGGYGETVIRRTKGTRFATASSLRSFLNEMKNHTGNPFPNRTVLVYPRADDCTSSPRKPIHKLYKRFPTLVENFGDDIWSLEYCVKEDVPASIYGLRSLYDMDSLRSLAMYTKDWNKQDVIEGLIEINRELESYILPHRQKLAIRQNAKAAKYGENQKAKNCMGSLERLQIMGSNGILPLNYLFAPFGKQIKSLYFCFMDDASSLSNLGYAGEPRPPIEIDPVIRDSMVYSLPQLTPNITELKVYEVTADLIDRILPTVDPFDEYGNKLRYLKSLSIKLQRPYVRPLNRLCKAIDEHCSDTLVKLHLEVSRWPPADDVYEEEPAIEVDRAVKLELLEELIISYALYLQEPDFIVDFTAKCTNLKSLCLVSVNVHSQTFPDLTAFCEPLWPKLPKTLKQISIRYWNSSEDFLGKNWRKNGRCDPRNGTYYYHFCYAPKLYQTISRRKKKRNDHPEPIPQLQTCERPKDIDKKKVKVE